jgi:uncharacterized membrane protein
VHTVAVTTVVHVPCEEVYDFLVDFPGYADYSKHLARVSRRGDGDAGTRYALTFEWWRLAYTAHAEVTDLDPPETIPWRLTRDLDARGAWHLDPAPEAAADGEATRVRFEVAFDPDTAHAGLVDLPALVSFDWLREKVTGLVRAEGERVVERVVADLEGERRPVELTVTVERR